MAVLTFDALLRSLKQEGGAPAPAYYLHGDEDVLKDEAVREVIARALDPAARDFNLDVRDAAELDPAQFRALVDTPPMLADRRVVVLRGVEQIRKTARVRAELMRYLESPNPTTVLLLVQAAGEMPDADLAGRAQAVSVQSLAPERVGRWVGHRAQALGLALEPEALEALIEATGGELGTLARELEKLAAVAAGRAATRDDVTALVGVRRGETLSDLVDAALARRGAAASRLVEPVLAQAGMSGVRIATALGTALLGTALARAELDRGTPRARLEPALLGHLRAARPYGVPGWEQTAAQWAQWASLWSASELSHALRRALDADRRLKSTTVTDERGIVEQLVLSWAVRAREAA